MVKKPIDKFDGDVLFGDLILVELPSEITICSGRGYGNDYAVGFFEKSNRKNIYLRGLQKLAYSEPKAVSFPRADIKFYEILRRYKLNPEKDEIDFFLKDAKEAFDEGLKSISLSKKS